MAKELTDAQRSELISQFVEIVVDNMDTKTLVQYVTDDLEHFYENRCDDVELKEFIDNHDCIYVVEQNRDAQLRTLLMLDIDIQAEKLISMLHYNGLPISADFVVERVLEETVKGRAA